jgi:hypothetical protein
MSSSEVVSAEVARSVENIEAVYRYAKGEIILPIQDPGLEHGYVSALGGYYHLTEKALLDEDVINLMKRGRVGVGLLSDHPFLARFNRPRFRVISYRPGSADSVCLDTKEPRRLVYSVQNRFDALGNIMTPDQKESFDKWRAEVTDEYGSQEDGEAMVFGHHIEDRRLHVYGYRGMTAEDLMRPGIMSSYLSGIGETFRSLRDIAEIEVATKFNNERDVDRVKAITRAFIKANSVIEDAFKPRTARGKFPARGTQ